MRAQTAENAHHKEDHRRDVFTPLGARRRHGKCSFDRLAAARSKAPFTCNHKDTQSTQGRLPVVVHMFWLRPFGRAEAVLLRFTVAVSERRHWPRRGAARCWRGGWYQPSRRASNVTKPFDKEVRRERRLRLGNFSQGLRRGSASNAREVSFILDDEEQTANATGGVELKSKEGPRPAARCVAKASWPLGERYICR